MLRMDELDHLPLIPLTLHDDPVPRAGVPLAFTDCETTELDPHKRRAWEVAVVRREPDGTTRAVHLMITDVDLTGAAAQALEVGRFGQRHPRGRELMEAAGFDVGHLDPAARPDVGGATEVTELEAAVIIAAMTRGAHIVGAVPDFDVRTYRDMIDRHAAQAAHWAQALAENWAVDTSSLGVELVDRYAELGRAPETLRWGGHYHLVDVENLAAGALAWPPPYDSDVLSRAVGVAPMDNDVRHTALGDTLWAMHIYDAAMTRKVVARNSPVQGADGRLHTAGYGTVAMVPEPEVRLHDVGRPAEHGLGTHHVADGAEIRAGVGITGAAHGPAVVVADVGPPDSGCCGGVACGSGE